MLSLLDPKPFASDVLYEISQEVISASIATRCLKDNLAVSFSIAKIHSKENPSTYSEGKIPAIALQEDIDEISKEELVRIICAKNQPLKDFFLLIDSLIELERVMQFEQGDLERDLFSKLSKKIDYMLEILKEAFHRGSYQNNQKMITNIIRRGRTSDNNGTKLHNGEYLAKQIALSKD